MLKRYGFIVLALGLFFSASSLAQESGEEALDQQTEGDGQNAGKGSPAPLGLPVRILEDPEEVESAKRAQSRAEQREIDDLVAQQNAAEAAEGAFKVGIAQTILAFFGTLALIYSLLLNRTATKAAVDAVKVSERTGVAQVRAYVGIAVSEVRLTGGPITTDIEFKNFGQSAARNTGICIKWYCGHEFCSDFKPEENDYQYVGALAPGQPSIAAIDTSKSEDAAIEGATLTDSSGVQDGRWKFWVFGEARYTDDFGKAHRTTFRLQLVPFAPRTHFILCAEGNEMT